MYTKHSVAVLSSIILGPCSFSAFAAVDENICQLIGGPPTIEFHAPNPPKVIFEDQDRIIVYHGLTCTGPPELKDVFRVEEKLEIPPYASEATVFLNGWRVQYTGLLVDHHVRAFGTAISNIRLEGKTLKWQAAGVLRDRNFDDSYRWCYSYTAIAWNPAFIKLAVDHKDGSCNPGDPVDPRQTNFFSADNGAATTALSSFSTFIQNPNFASSKTVAILPRGFEFTWSDPDHHLLQTAYSLDHSETFVETDKRYRKGLNEAITPFPSSAPRLSLVGSGAVSWETSAIFKDNDTRRDYLFGEIVSGLGGDDVGVIQPPPFSVLPHEDVGFFGACSQQGTKTGDQTEEFEIDNVPFEYAIPMLTGWELKYACDDEHVAEMGIGIDTWDYDQNTRTLHYTLSSILRDRDSHPGFAHGHKVTVLGIRQAAGGGTPHQAVPDLVPFSPLGTDFIAFCRLEQDRQLLRVTVNNQGNENAAASKTKVLFGDSPVTLDTPPIPAGGSTDLLFNVPPGCMTPSCLFQITVDSDNQVDESGNEGNNSVNGGCLG
jgi:CARDB